MQEKTFESDRFGQVKVVSFTGEDLEQVADSPEIQGLVSIQFTTPYVGAIKVNLPFFPGDPWAKAKQHMFYTCLDLEFVEEIIERTLLEDLPQPTELSAMH